MSSRKTTFQKQLSVNENDDKLLVGLNYESFHENNKLDECKKNNLFEGNQKKVKDGNLSDHSDEHYEPLLTVRRQFQHDKESDGL